jgi:tRNA uridine 5-carbamoylmethylation protein Kti12
MATLVQILGEPGSGKTYSMRNLDPKQVFYINADAKNMPFKGWKGKYNTESKNYLMSSDITLIATYLKRISEAAPHVKVVVIDTLNSIMSDKEMSERKKKGWN